VVDRDAAHGDALIDYPPAVSDIRAVVVAPIAFTADHRQAIRLARRSRYTTGCTRGTILTCPSPFLLRKYQTIRLPWPRRRNRSGWRGKRWQASARLSLRRPVAHRRAGRRAGCERPLGLASTRTRRSVDQAHGSRQRLYQRSVRQAAYSHLSGIGQRHCRPWAHTNSRDVEHGENAPHHVLLIGMPKAKAIC
jgi:hypothetical protein